MTRQSLHVENGKKTKNEQAAPTWAGTQPGAPYRAYQEKKKKVGIWEVWHNTARPKEEDAGRNKVGLDSKAKQACVSGGK